ncbi:GIY-YIG nuclease superfamily protein [Chryseobacterium phage MA9V-2]|nr:GIY-YIG nuclease superfamily protein [Chryseobacterium phage MA9V-2]
MYKFIYVWYNKARFFDKTKDLPWIYIGMHRGHIDDGYISSSIYLNTEMQQDTGNNWQRIIIKRYEDSVSVEEVYAHECALIRAAFKRYGFSKVLNRTATFNKPTSKGKVRLIVPDSNGAMIWVPKANKEAYLELGYATLAGKYKTIGKLKITNGEENKLVTKEAFAEMDQSIWRIGQTNRVEFGKAINKDGQVRYAKSHELDSFLAEGWTLGIGKRPKSPKAGDSMRGKVAINKDGRNKYVMPEELDTFLADGYIRGTVKCPTENLICVNKDGKNKFIMHEEVDAFLADGWTLGNTKRGKRRLMNNGEHAKHVPNEEVDAFLADGWVYGKIINADAERKVCINKDGSTKFVSPSVIEAFLADGWKYGSPNKGSRKLMTKDGERNRYINESDIEAFLADGWTLGNKKV